MGRTSFTCYSTAQFKLSSNQRPNAAKEPTPPQIQPTQTGQSPSIVVLSSESERVHAGGKIENMANNLKNFGGLTGNSHTARMTAAAVQ